MIKINQISDCGSKVYEKKNYKRKEAEVGVDPATLTSYLNGHDLPL